MSDKFWDNLPAILTSLGAIVAVVLSHWRTSSKLAASAEKLAENTEITKETKEKLTNGLTSSVEEIHKATNGMKSELVKATAALEFAKGLAAGKLLAEHDKKGT